MLKITKTLFALSCALVLSLSATAQVIQPPDLICVTTLFDGNVELRWELPPANPCGAFLGYRIYATPNATAPYSQIGTVTNPAQTTFIHINANGNTQTWYYYVTTDLQCPTFQVQQSAVLDNRDPETPPLTAVSINPSGSITLTWENSPSPETAAYVIYQETPSGFVAIDTIFGRGVTQYEHTGVNVAQKQTYTIAAMDACGNIGLLYQTPHETILLDATVSRCTQSIDLTWDEYQNWKNPIAAHQIRATVNGAPRALVRTVSGLDFSASLLQYNDGDLVCLTVQAVELETGEGSTTNEVCVVVDIVEPQDFVYLSNINVTDDGDLEVLWNWDSDADLQNYTLIKSGTETVQPRPDPLQPLAYLLDTAFVADTGSVVVQISSLDSCGTVALSTTAKTIFLEGSPGANYKNLLRWSPFEMDFGEVISYQIYRIVVDIPELIGSVNANTLTYSDEVNGAEPNESNIRYYVVARVFIELPDGTAKEVISQSNTTLIKQRSKIFMPNAFAPEGTNQELRPLMVFAENAEFQMFVYDRWGKLIFQTNDPATGWDGRINGALMRQGVYTYVVRVTQLDGEMVEEKGTFLLIR